ncbi:hypothetical protein DPMN_161743 [Dreissena polymorpha]|uniref:Nuclease HARBI1 n=1 Tax=Dreissena polymorpha TaxID=45954 RepID=A0A9D4EQZ5_DREPO|nr:hypothetical protein DPMN_161743 [Dreissena polymorpha]
MEVYRRYRFIPATILTLLNLVADSLDFGTLRNSPLLPIQQLCIFLRAMATGSFQLVVGDTVRVSQPSVSRCCRRVGRAIARLARRYVRFPDREECKTLKSRFQSIAGDVSRVEVAELKKSDTDSRTLSQAAAAFRQSRLYGSHIPRESSKSYTDRAHSVRLQQHSVRADCMGLTYPESLTKIDLGRQRRESSIEAANTVELPKLGPCGVGV